MGAKLILGLAIVGLKLFGGSGTVVKDAPPPSDPTGSTTPPPDEPKPEKTVPKGLSKEKIAQYSLLANVSYTQGIGHVRSGVAGALRATNQDWLTPYAQATFLALDGYWVAMAKEEKANIWLGKFK